MTRSRVRSVISMLVVAAGLLAVFAQPAAASPGAFKVLWLNAVGGGCDTDTDVQNQMATLPGVAKVDGFDASNGTPTVAQLDPYDEVVVHSDCDGFQDTVAAGNNLADYADHGGVVVEYAYTTEIGIPDELTGRWQSGGYSPYVHGNNDNNAVTLGTFDSSSPLMAGVNSLTSTGCNVSPTLAPGATRVARWDNGQEAIATKGQAVSVTASIDDSGCSWSGDYAQLNLNAVKMLDKHIPPTGTAISKAKINRKKRTAKFVFSAPGTVTGFDCALGRKKKGKKLKLSFRACSSPKRYKHLKPGKYTFEVRATNQYGSDLNPATRKFKI
jgi:hypothetical protein